MKDPQDVTRFARSTRALLAVHARDKTAEQRMIDMIEHVITVLQDPAGQQVSLISPPR
jgi:hypothetical protein